MFVTGSASCEDLYVGRTLLNEMLSFLALITFVYICFSLKLLKSFVFSKIVYEAFLFNESYDNIHSRLKLSVGVTQLKHSSSNIVLVLGYTFH